ncbi:MAG: hypothetical protein NVS3B26_27500 [Mycobacteriales bacterium]
MVLHELNVIELGADDVAARPHSVSELRAHIRTRRASLLDVRPPATHQMLNPTVTRPKDGCMGLTVRRGHAGSRRAPAQVAASWDKLLR